MVLVVFVAPLATVVLAGLAGSWTGALPSDLGFAHVGGALSGENLASLSVSLQTAVVAGGVALVLGAWAALASREAPPWLSRIVDAVFHLPIAVPSVALGLGLVIAFNAAPLLLGGTRWIVDPRPCGPGARLRLQRRLGRAGPPRSAPTVRRRNPLAPGHSGC